MLNTLFTLFKARSSDASIAFADANALPVLRQQIRDASVSLKRSRQAVALAMADEEKERSILEKIDIKIADLENRALAAIEAKKHGFANEAAEAIAVLENDRTYSKKALERFHEDISRMKGEILTAQTRLRDLQRGERLATANQQTQKLAQITPLSGESGLRDAEETLARLEQRQRTVDLTRKAELSLCEAATPDNLSTRMAAEGLGKPLQSSAEQVLERLKSKSEKK